MNNPTPKIEADKELSKLDHKKAMRSYDPVSWQAGYDKGYKTAISKKHIQALIDKAVSAARYDELDKFNQPAFSENIPAFVVKDRLNELGAKDE